MKRDYVLLTCLSLVLFLSGCLNDQPKEPTLIIEPPPVLLISTDTIKTGGYMGFDIGEGAEETYYHVKALQISSGVTYLNIVGNVFEGLNGLEERMPLYQSVFLDERRGTDSGIQLSLVEGRVKSIFLNSGKKLNQWPEKPRSLPAVNIGDAAETLYHKLEKISADKAYKNKFEYISLLTKDLTKAYDPPMADAPQWYFAYTLGEDKMDEVKLNFKEGKLYEILINHYQRY